MKAISRLSLLFSAALLLAGAVMAAEGTAGAPATEPVAKVVWHVDFSDPRRLSAMIQNVNNMVTTYQNKLEDYDIRLVFLAGGIRFVTQDPLKGTPFAEDPDFKKRRTSDVLCGKPFSVI